MDQQKRNERIDEILSGMTLEEKIGQMFVVRRPQDDAIAMQALLQYHLGGFTLYACDFEHRTPDSVRSLLASYRRAAAVAPFIAVDEEGGRVVRASKYPAFRATPFPDPRQLLEAGGLGAVEADTREKAAFLLDLGINFNYAPVCDMSGDPGSFIFDRTASHDPVVTAGYVDAVVRAMQECGLVGSIKHFPGYGDNVDTHTSIAHDDRSMETFLESDLEPFRAGIAAGAPIVMIAHNIVSCMDKDSPASLSPAVHRSLRETLGFDGLIMTDSLDMGAITQYTHDRAAAVQAVLAGNDLLCCSTYEKQVPAVWEAVSTGVISEDRIEASVRRILELKSRVGII